MRLGLDFWRLEREEYRELEIIIATTPLIP